MSKRIVDSWNRIHPNIQIEMQPLPAGRSSEEVLMASIVGKTTPDICSNILSGTVERMVRAKALVPLSSFSDFTKTVHDRSPLGTLDLFRSSDGKVYQMPWKANPKMLMVNSFLVGHGFDNSRNTYSDFFKIAKELTRDTDGDGRIDQWAIGLEIQNTWWKRFDDLYPFYIAASGGQTLVNGKKILFEGQPMVQALGFLRELFERGYAPYSYFAADLFLQGKVAMVLGSAPNIPEIELKKPKFPYDFVPLPVPDSYKGPYYTFGDIKSIVVFSSCKYPKVAWEFIKYFVSTKADLELLKQTSQLPMRKNLLIDEPFASFFKSKPKLAKLAKQIQNLRGTDDTIHLVEIFDVLSQAYETGAVYRLLPADQAVTKAAKRVQRVIEMWE